MESLNFWKIAACVPLAAAAVSAHGQMDQVSFTAGAQGAGHWTFHHEHVLGTSLEMTFHAANADDAVKAEQAVLAAFDRDDAVLSTWRADSEVSRWAATRMEAVKVSPELFEVLAGFDAWREKTGGALDASVEAATRLWKQAASEGRTPTARETAVAVEAMQQAHWQLDREHGTATRLSDVPLALASFTKSYVSSRAADTALRSGASGVMLNVGGDVIVRGDLTQMVAVADPLASAENDRAMEHVVVRNRAVATSGGYRRGFEIAGAVAKAAPEYSHLIDPRTAAPVRHILSSTVIAKDAVTAGALATALSVMPVEDGQRLAAGFPDAQYLLVMAEGEQVRSAGWPGAGRVVPAAFAGKGAPVAAAGLWNQAFELSVDLELPRIEDARARRPYVAVWVEDADHFPVRTLALWLQNPRWLPELKQWYRGDQVRSLAEGTDVSRTVSSATRTPGKYTLKWDGKDNEGKLVKAGTYTVCVEVSREHGGYDIERQTLTFGAKPEQMSTPAAKEVGAVTFDYHKK